MDHLWGGDLNPLKGILLPFPGVSWISVIFWEIWNFCKSISLFFYFVISFQSTFSLWKNISDVVLSKNKIWDNFTLYTPQRHMVFMDIFLVFEKKKVILHFCAWCVQISINFLIFHFFTNFTIWTFFPYSSFVSKHKPLFLRRNFRMGGKYTPPPHSREMVGDFL